MRFVFAFLLALIVSLSGGISLAETICDRPNGTLIMVRQENQIEVSFLLTRDGNKMRGMARYNAGPSWRADRGPVSGEIGANGGMFWQVFWESGSIGTYKGTLVDGKGQGVTHGGAGNATTRYRYIADTPPGCTRWSWMAPAKAPKVVKALKKPKPPGSVLGAPMQSDLLTSKSASGAVALVAAPNMAGEWTVVSDKPWGFRMSFVQQGAEVSGTYVIDVNGVVGRIRGTLSGNVLTFTFDQDGGYTGDGRIVLSPDGRTFNGTYRTDDNGTLTPDLLQGIWNGTRL
jgi:hypothetical protein